ncbi:MAG: ABC transporter substrate-binding protein [Oscillospiraceae bacterium]|nr:ABC transporter substrate-binding protein [Oscillospiraceae bacterium]MBR0450634.1 ABC transporter substrate-binding protein [Oscillospiraceae bacterium]
MKRITALLLIVLSLVVMLTSCGGGSTTPEDGGNDNPTPSPEPTPTATNARPTTNGREENMLTVPMGGSVPATLDPDHFGLQNEDSIINEVYETLIRQGVDESIRYFLAEEITPNDDGSMNLTLRDATFHSGDKLTAEDVVYTFQRIETSSLNSGIYGMIDFEVIDDTHLIMHFPFADQGATYEALIPYLVNVRIMNKKWTEERVEDINGSVGLEENGTGAYVFAGVSDGGDVTLTRFEDYWGEAYLDTIKMKYLSGDANIAFEAGDVDYCGYSPTTVPVAEAYDNVSVVEIPTSSTTFLIIGCNEALPTSDIRVRQAIAYAMNRADIAEAASDGGGKVNHNIASPTVKYYTDDVEKFERDLDRSKQLLTEAGYSESNKVAIELITLGSNTQWISACELVKANLEESYFTVEITQVDGAARYFNADYTMGIINFSYFADFKAWNILFDMASGLDLAGYTDPAILETFAAINDEASTQKAMRDAVDTVAYYPLFSPVTYLAYDSNLEIGDYANGLVYMRDIYWK